ncbi:hypothetical protein B0H11DRAFT_1946897 [Mycena galericulata]|nr:hypothetical protein B0H11DRAFT_1946897 [Mycena galericulata]
MVEYDAPLLLCHVSRAWRHLALNTPRLWVSLHICLPPSDRVSFMNNWAKEWLSRSGILPLSISFFADRPFSETFDQDLGTVFDTLISFSLRWEHIRFNMPTYTTFSPLASLSPADVPSLRTATVTIKGFGRTSNDHPLDPVADWDNLSFLGSTGVHSACISANSTNLSLLPLRWERLRRLSFRGTFAVNAPVALAILKQCPLLEMCSLMVLLGDLPPLSPCRLEHLRDLYVMDRGGGFGSMQLFANLVAPKLAYLQYTGEFYTSECPFTPMLSSSRSLERLGVYSSGVHKQVLLDTLSLVPTLRHLLLSGEPVFGNDDDAWHTDPFFILSLNEVATGGGVLCPNLEDIELLEFVEMSDETLLQFIQARAGPATRLSRVHASLRRERQVDILPLLQTLTEDGLGVSLDYKPRSEPWERVPHTYLPWKGLEWNAWAPFSQSDPW